MPGASRQHAASALLAHVPERERELRCAVAGQHAAVGRDHEMRARPAAHAGLRPVAEVVGQHEQDLGARRARAFLGHHLRGGLELLARRQQRGAVRERPAVVLRVRELEPVGVERARERDQLAHAAEVAAVQHDVQREREPERAHRAREGELPLEARRAGDRVRGRGLRVLHRELHAAQAGLLERREARRVDRQTGRHEMRVEPGRGRARARSRRDRAAWSARRP